MQERLKIRILKEIRYNNKKYLVGEECNIPPDIFEVWIKQKIAEPIIDDIELPPKKLRTEEFRFCKVGKDKKPIGSEWQFPHTTSNYSYDDKEFVEHIKQGGNYGVVTGFNDLLVIDFDNDWAYEVLKKYLPETFIVKTGGKSLHYYYFIDEGASFKIQRDKGELDKNGKKIIETLIDFQCQGKQVVGTGSTHSSGKKYTIYKDLPIKSITKKWLNDLIKREFPEDFWPTHLKKEIKIPEQKKPEENIVEEIKSEVKITDYDSSLKNGLQGCPFHSDKNPSFSVFENGRAFNCFSGCGGGDIFSYVQLKENCNFIEAKEKLMKFAGIEENRRETLYQKAELVLKDIQEKKLEDFLIFKKNDEGKVTKTSVNVDAVAFYVINRFDIKTIFGLKEENIFVYDEGIWTITGKGLIKYEIENLLFSHARNNVVSEIVEKIKRKTEIARFEFDKIPDFKTPVENGVLDLTDFDNIKFVEHKKEYNFKTKLPVKYVEGADCPQIIKFINDVFYPADVPQVQEWLGLHLVNRYLFKKAVICYGEANTGKSVFLNLLSAFVGEENVSGLGLQRISIGKSFDLLSLKDKFANIYDDLSSKDLGDGGGFKMCVGDGMICGEQKFGDMIKFRNTAKMTFACNKIPSVKEIDDPAYYGRWLMWSFDNVVSPEEIDYNLVDKLTTPEELSGLLNWSIEGLKRLAKNNKFSNEKPAETIKHIMVTSGNSLALFVENCLEKDNRSRVTKEEMYTAYCFFCSKQKPELSPCSKEQLGRRLQKYATFLRPSSNGKERYWQNVKYNDTYDTFFDFLYNKKKGEEREKKEEKEKKNNIYKIQKSVIPVIEEEFVEDKIKLKKTDNTIHKCKDCKSVPCTYQSEAGYPYCSTCATDTTNFEVTL